MKENPMLAKKQICGDMSLSFEVVPPGTKRSRQSGTMRYHCQETR
jgi:hypothetical protein